MKRSKFTEDQIIGILRQAGAEVRAVDLCRQHGILDATFYKWRTTFGGMNISDAKRLRHLEKENARLKRPPARLPQQDAPRASAASSIRIIILPAQIFSKADMSQKLPKICT